MIRVEEIRARTEVRRLATEMLGWLDESQVDERIVCQGALGLLAVVDQLTDALTFYADQGNWTQLTSWGGRIFDDESDAVNDCGTLARSVLSRVGGGQADEPVKEGM